MYPKGSLQNLRDAFDKLFDFKVAILVVMLCIYCVFYNTQLWVCVLLIQERFMNK